MNITEKNIHLSWTDFSNSLRNSLKKVNFLIVYFLQFLQFLILLSFPSFQLF